MENCIFDKIIKGEIPAAKVWEDENYLAFMSIAPINPGHTLVIPKKHIEYIFDMEDGDLSGLINTCKPLAKAMTKAFHPTTGKVGIIVAGLEVPHVHIHLIPMNGESDLNLARAKHDVPFEQIEEDAQKIREALNLSLLKI